MQKFDLFNFFQEQLLREQPEDQQPDPNQQQAQQAPVQDQQQPQEPTADQSAQQQAPSVSTPFDQFTGATIDNIQFQPHENGGAIIVKHSLSPLPLVISWTGDRVTAKYKDVTPLT